ncbi:MAG TPA: thioredoxin domain-containing protein [Terriglobia bacterium]|nr:thioredoxin domain-containing protein [Terriglobia bacterium]
MSLENPGNELAKAASAYLRSAAHQPVLWREWNGAAFALAQAEDKPILLDIGAVWCHWCHVMDRESYENAEVARIINDAFIPVKVDRDERPDIDARYQVAVSALTGQGGWPLTAFLTPDGKPFYGGTYFPPDDRSGRPGMKRLLEAVAHNYRTHRDQIQESAAKIAEALREVDHFKEGETAADEQVVKAIVESIAGMFDAQNGGFGHAPKFPHPSAIDLLLEAYLETRQEWLLTMVTTTLEHMGRGGVYDQIGGGFHRYSVDERWIVPHFEKMSYDNAGLLGNYLRSYQITGNPFFREIALGILAFLENVLSHPAAGFYSSQDADINLDDDGDYFTWTLEELNAVLEGPEARVAALYYHIEAQGEMHHNPAKNVLFIDQPLSAIAARMQIDETQVAELLASARRKMADARARRQTPFIDKSIYASWNGMLISALLEAYRVLGNAGERERDRGLATLDLLLTKAFDREKGMYHTLVDGAPRIEGLLEDQVFIIAALLDAYEITGTRSYFERALDLMEITVRRFWDEKGGGFFDTALHLADRHGSLTTQRKPFQDSPTPAANAVAAQVLDRLDVLADREDFGEKAAATLALFAPKAGPYGLFAATYGLALLHHLRAPVDVVVVGGADDDRTRSLLRAAYDAPRAGKRVFALEPGIVQSRDLPAGLAATLPQLPFDGIPVALVCEGSACHPPVQTPAALRELLAPTKPA